MSSNPAEGSSRRQFDALNCRWDIAKLRSGSGSPNARSFFLSGEKCPFHLRKRTSPFVHRGEMHFVVQKMGKLQLIQQRSSPSEHHALLARTITAQHFYSMPLLALLLTRLVAFVESSCSRTRGASVALAIRLSIIWLSSCLVTSHFCPASYISRPNCTQSG